jgi:hypothetical protein
VEEGAADEEEGEEGVDRESVGVDALRGFGVVAVSLGEGLVQAEDERERRDAPVVLV